MLIFIWKNFISFVNGAKLPKDLPCLKISICLRIFGGFFLEKQKGGSEKVEIFCIFKFGHLQFFFKFVCF